MATISRLSVSLTANPTKFRKGLRSASKAVDSFQSNIFSLKGAIVGLAGVAGLGAMVTGLVGVNENMQKLKSSLKTVTGGVDQAEKAFDVIEKFATTTPFELNEVVGSFIKLKALGLDPSEDALRSYGNTASAMGKSLDQMIEAVADAATGEFERLKEFGIKARKQGEEISFTFQGVTTTVKNNAADITSFLQSIGNNQFGNAMSDQMGTLGTSFSNFGIAIQGLQTAIGEAGVNDFITSMTNSMTDFITSLDKSEIKSFTQDTLTGFADLLDGVKGFVKYLENSDIASLGLIGYIFLGKKGIALAGIVDYVNQLFANDLARNWDFLNPSEITGGPTLDFASNYQLGDFNNAQPAADFDQWAADIRGAGDQQVEEQKTTNGILESIADQLRQSAAVAG